MKTSVRAFLNLAATLTAVGLVMPAGVAFGQSPSGPTAVYGASFEATNPSTELEVIQRVIEFEPGAGSPPHTPRGPLLITVLEGEVTLRRGGTEERFTAGRSWIENPGELDEPFNDSPMRARILMTALLPNGAPLVTFPETGRSGPQRAFTTSVYDSKFVVANQPAQLTVVQWVLDFVPNAWTTPHVHGGPALFLVLEGELTLHTAGMERRLNAGESWVEEAGQVHAVGNSSAVGASVAVTLVVPKGVELTSVQAPPDAGPAPPCIFTLGFSPLRDQILADSGDVVGACLENEHGNTDPATGRPVNLDTLQRTTGGLMLWQQFTNTMSFTNGFQTWTYSACGLQGRLNMERFVWERSAAIAVQTMPAPGTCDLDEILS